MPNLLEKYVTSFTLQGSPHQHRTTPTPEGNLASFVFDSLIAWYEQGKIIADKKFGDQREQWRRMLG
jgi:hypothetical protein